ncbi:amidase [Paenarthrobacter aurescens]|uniref:Amidase n=1 Tax=Paenarthrobacter aurescens (strain TC1) TaxID=290340 RepID=A1RDJ4_PAEAT|nr:amidase [Paenarthrobacter aurescens]ABM10653.1 amidase [Paenarthrobacter aurescens TC1]
MSIQPPDLAAFAKAAVDGELGIKESDLAAYHAAAEGLLGSWRTVEELYSEIAPIAPKRSWSRPAAGDNGLGAWSVQTQLQEVSSGPLAGRTVVIKDNVSVAGVPMMNGSRTLEGFVPSEDATVVTRLLGAGATIVGKAVCEDLCFSGGSHTSKPGPVRNPWNHAHASGGSSSGSGALVAAGEVDMAIGGDQGGSIRIPAAFCGVVGHKPTHGLVPYTGGFPIEQSIDHLGPITRTVTDAALMLSVIAGRDEKDPRQPDRIDPVDYVAALGESAKGLRVGVVTEGFGRENSEPEVDDTVRSAVETLRSVGLQAADVSIPWHLYGGALWDVLATEGGLSQMIDGNAYGMNWKGHYDPQLIEYYGRKWRSDPSMFSETVKLVILAGRHALATQHGRHYAMARNLAPRLAAAYDDALDQYDVLVMPTLTTRAPVLAAPDGPVEETFSRAFEMLPQTSPFDITGHPACTVPAGLAGGLPVGLMIIGKRFHDATVLRVAHAFENAVGGFPLPIQERSKA